MRPGTCIHYNGINNGACKANHNYLDAAIPLTQEQVEWHDKNYPETPRSMTGIVDRIPCHANNNLATCPDYREPTQDELDRQEAEIKNLLRQTIAARAAIVDYLKANDLLKKNTGGQIPCPICGSGTLNFRIAGAYNGHIHAQCTTPKCVQWME